MNRSKRDLAASLCHYTGITKAMTFLPGKRNLVVVNYHRIGSASEAVYSSQVFSATADEFDAQLRFLSQHFCFTTLDEVIERIGNATPWPEPTVLVTFDDGYLDNYELAFPILRAHGAQAVFFLPTSFIGTDRIPWWDQISFIVKHAKQRKFRIRGDASREFDLASMGTEQTIWELLLIFKQGNTESDEFLTELEEATGTARASGSRRCFLNWEEAAEMLQGGMAVGSHAQSHEMLGNLSESKQIEELTGSKEILERHLGTAIQSLSYPIGTRVSFSAVTRAAAAAAGYRAAFSFYGGFNSPGRMNRFDIQRVAVDNVGRHRFEFRAMLATVTGKYWF